MAAVTRAADVSDTLLAKTYLYFGHVAIHATPIYDITKGCFNTDFKDGLFDMLLLLMC